MPPFTPEQQEALSVAFNVVCLANLALEYKITALELLCVRHGVTDYDGLDSVIDMARDHRELNRLAQPHEETIRQAVARILAGEITEADRAEAFVFPCDPPREMLGGPHS